MHLVQLGRNIAQRQVRISDCDPSNQPHQMILGLAARGALDQLRLNEFLAHHPLDCPAQAFDGPIVPPAIEDPHDVVPTMLRPQLSYGWQPCLRRRD